MLSSWPYYNDWCEIFGRDRAPGEHADSFVDVVQEDALNLRNTDGAAMDVGLEKMLDGFEDNGDSISVSAPIFSDAISGKKSVGKKRKQRAEIEDLSYYIKYLGLLNMMLSTIEFWLGCLVSLF